MTKYKKENVMSLFAGRKMLYSLDREAWNQPSFVHSWF